MFAVIAVALVMGLVFGGLRVADAESNAAQFHQVSQLANLGVQDTALIQDLENERDATTGIVNSGGGAATLSPLFAATDTAAGRVRQAAADVGGALPANIRADIATLLADISPGGIAVLHHTLQSGEDAPAAMDSYGVPITAMITLNDLISQGVSDAELANDVRALNFLSLAKEEASRQRGLLNGLFNDQYFVGGDPSPNDSAELSALNLATIQEDTDESAFLASATAAERAEFAHALSAPQIGTAAEIEEFVYGNAPVGPASAPIIPNPLGVITAIGFTLKEVPRLWFDSMSARVDSLRTVEETIAANIASRGQSLENGARQAALVTGIIAAAVLLLVLAAALLVARSLVQPLRRLRTGALDVASVQLPERVRQLSESPDGAADLDVAPIDVLTTDEIGQVARAFDQVHAEAVRLAGNEAMLRASFNAVFVNLSRRSQSLIERLARTIESLEQNEDDPDRLSSLFSMDHMVTRMRRNSENLLLLAGHEGARKWSEPVALADVARAAASEIEQYGRVVLNVQPGVAVVGQAVSDVVHLLAELIENATIFSPSDTQVLVSGQDLSSGGVLIEIMDRGVGVSQTRLAEMNWRLDNPPVMDVSVSRHMGLFAVVRLAERHNIRIRLRTGTVQGLSALVWLPESVIQRSALWSALPSARRASPAVAQPGADSGEQDEQDSNWFRSRRISATNVGGGGWHTDDVWAQGRHAAEIITDPVRGNQTAAGLPLRVPQANLLPGSVGGPGQSGDARLGGGRSGDGPARLTPPPGRSPDLARSMLTGFQHGARRGRGRRPGSGEPAGFGHKEYGAEG